MLHLLENLEWRDKDGNYTSTKKPFQKGLIASIRSTIALFNELKEEDIQYVLTKR